MQAIQLGYMPASESQLHFGARHRADLCAFGELVTDALCIGLVLGFQQSSNLAAAYGVAITTTM